MLTPEELNEICRHIADCPAYLDELSTYKKQALENHSKAQLARLNAYTPDEKTYYYALDNAGPCLYRTSEKVLALLGCSSVQQVQVSKKLTIKQIALLCHYNETLVADSQIADRIAREHGYTAKSSGGQLRTDYNGLSRIHNRVGVEGQQIAPRIRDIKAVLPHLNGLQLQQANNELDTIMAKK